MLLAFKLTLNCFLIILLCVLSVMLADAGTGESISIGRANCVLLYDCALNDVVD
jgi:hypothetical protein